MATYSSAPTPSWANSTRPWCVLECSNMGVASPILYLNELEAAEDIARILSQDEVITYVSPNGLQGS